MTAILDLPAVSGSFNLVAYADWRAPILFAVAGGPFDLSGIAFRAQMRLSASDPTIWLDLSTANGGLINQNDTGVLELVAPATMTRFVPPGAYVLDVVAQADGATVNVCGGAPFTVIVTQGVTVA